MSVLRTIAAILVGYFLFALGSMLTISLWVGKEGGAFAALAFVALAVIGLVAGLAASLISGKTKRLAGAIHAGLIALATLVNLLMQFGAEPSWYKVATLLVTVPSILLVTFRGSQER